MHSGSSSHIYIVYDIVKEQLKVAFALQLKKAKEGCCCCWRCKGKEDARSNISDGGCTGRKKRNQWDY
jgi:hypothetical protein